jgi:hypothetical protein
MKGIDLINDAVSMFDKVVEKLNKGVDWCLQETTRQDQVIKEAQSVITSAESVKLDLKLNVERAYRVRDKVKSIIE